MQPPTKMVRPTRMEEGNGGLTMRSLVYWGIPSRKLSILGWGRTCRYKQASASAYPPSLFP